MAAGRRWNLETLLRSARNIINPSGKKAKWRGKVPEYAPSMNLDHERTIPFAGTKTVLFQFNHDGLTESGALHRVQMQFQGLQVVRERGMSKEDKDRYKADPAFFRQRWKGEAFFVEKPNIQTAVKVRCTCFTGDTLIPLADGHSVPIRELVGLEEFFVYSFDSDKRKVRIARGHSCRKTGEQQMILRVLLDNGQTIRCTPDHRFLLKDGSWKEAADLHSGDGLEPLYRRVSEKGRDSLSGYEQVYQPHSGRWIYTHVLTDIWMMSVGLAAQMIGKFVRHHRDFDKRNNHPDNLVRMGVKEHALLHGRGVSRRMRKFNPMHDRSVVEKAVRTNRERGNYEGMGHRFRASDPLVHAKATHTLRKRIEAGEVDLRPNMQKANARHRELIAQGISHLQTDERREGLRTLFIADNPMAKSSARAQVKKSKHEQFLKRRQPVLEWLRSLPSEGIRITQDHAKQFGFRRLDVFTNCVRILQRKTGIPVELIADSNARKLGTVVRSCGDLLANHKVVSVDFAGYEDVYCFTVEGLGNFAVDVGNGEDCSSGVFVSNCSDAFFRLNWWNHNEGAIFGRKPRGYKRKTTTAPSVNPTHKPGICKHMVNSVTALEKAKMLKPGTRKFSTFRV